MLETLAGILVLGTAVSVLVLAIRGVGALRRWWAFRRVRAFATSHGWQAARERDLPRFARTYGPYVWGSHRGQNFVFCRVITASGRNASRGGQGATGSSGWMELSPFVVLGDTSAADLGPAPRRGEARRAGRPSFTWECGDDYLAATVNTPRVLGLSWFPRKRLLTLLDDLLPLQAEQTAVTSTARPR